MIERIAMYWKIILLMLLTSAWTNNLLAQQSGSQPPPRYNDPGLQPNVPQHVGNLQPQSLSNPAGTFSKGDHVAPPFINNNQPPSINKAANCTNTVSPQGVFKITCN